MTARRFRLMMVSAALLAALSARAADLSPWDEWRLGYTNFEIGEKERGRGEYSAALSAFEKSRRHYQSVKRARPDWNQKVIRERLKACDRQIAELRRLLGDKPAPAAPAVPGEAAPSGTKPLPGGRAVRRSELPETAAQLKKLRAELAEAKAELEELRREHARRGNYETEIADLLRDQRVAREKYALLEKRYRKLQEELKTPDSSLQLLRQELMEKNARLSEAEKSILLLEERLRRSELAVREAVSKSNQLRSQTRRADEERQRLLREIEVTRSTVEAEQERVVRARSRIEELEKALRDADRHAREMAASAKNSEGAGREEALRLRALAEAAEKRAEQFQRQCVELRAESADLLKKLQTTEQLRRKDEKSIVELRAAAERSAVRADSLADELAGVRDLQRRQEAELKRALAELEPLRERLARRDSDDFKGLVAARDSVRKLEAEIAALKARDAEITVALSEEKERASSLRRELDLSRKDGLRLKGQLKNSEQDLERLRADADKLQELSTRYQELERNFAALHKENQENRVKLAAASPREAELRRIKLRLVELDQLKSSLGREQRLNAELLAENNRLQKELKIARDNGVRLAAARKQLESMKALRSELDELRRVNRETVARLEKLNGVENELLTTKKALIESGAAQLELLDVKQAYAKAVAGRDAAAIEIARLRDQLAETGENLKRETAERQRGERDAAALAEKLKKLDAELAATAKALAENRELRQELLELRQAYEQVARGGGDAAKESDRLRAELEQTRRQLRAERDKLAAADGRKNAADAEAEELRRQLRRAGDRVAALETSVSETRGVIQQLEKTRQQLRSSQEKVADLEALTPQLAKLRKLNDELMYARTFESDLVKARAQLVELSRYKEELAGVLLLNEQLVREKSELERELARRSVNAGAAGAGDDPLKQIIASAAEDPAEYLAAGKNAEAGGSVELAIWNYRKAVEAKPDHAEAAERLGTLLLRRGEFKEAARMLETAYRAAPGRLDLGISLARAFLGNRRFGNAQSVLEPLLKRHPENGEVLTVTAMAIADSGDAARAERLLKLAHRYAPNSAEPLIELSRLLVHSDSGRQEEAARLYETARIMGARPDVELEPALGPRLDERRELESFLTGAMNEAFENRDYHGAAWYCKQLQDIDRRPQYFSALLALAKFMGGENGGARETLTFNTESPQGALVLALIELKEGDKRAFSAAVRRALALNKGKKVILDAEWRHLGFALDAAAADPQAKRQLAEAYQWAAGAR